MAKRMLVFLAIGALILGACGDVASQTDRQATAVMAAAYATLSAQPPPAEIVIVVTPPPPTPEVEPSPPAAATTGPRFNPDGDPWCFDRPDPVLDKEWQVSAPRDVVVIGDSAEIGLRNKWGGSGESYEITARVIAPDGSEARALVRLTADSWANLVFPDDFASGDTWQRGVYTIIWEIEGGFIACDGFVTGGGASQSAIVRRAT